MHSLVISSSTVNTDFVFKFPWSVAARIERSKVTFSVLKGILRLRLNRGVNLAVRDFSSSDPYVVIKIGRKKLKSRVMKKNLNPQWNEDFSLSVSDPNLPILLTVYDHDLFSRDDKMGDAEFDVKPLLEAMRMDVKGLPSGTVLSRVQPLKHNNCLADESCIKYIDGMFCQDLILRLRNVECGELELSLNWIGN